MKITIFGPILWGHSGPLCHALSVVVVGVVIVVDIDVQAVSIATPGEWRVRRLAVANGPNIFRILLVIIVLVLKSVRMTS